MLHMPPWKRHKSRVAVSVCQTATGFVAALFATMRSSTPLAVRMRVAVRSDDCGHRHVVQVALAGGRAACLQASALCTHLTAFPLPLFLAPLTRDRRASVQPDNACNQLLGALCRAQEAVVNATQRAKQAGPASLIRQLPKREPAQPCASIKSCRISPRHARCECIGGRWRSGEHDRGVCCHKRRADPPADARHGRAAGHATLQRNGLASLGRRQARGGVEL